MMSLLRAIGRFFRAIGYALAGKTDEAARSVEANPYAMGAKYDDVIRGKKQRMDQYLNAVAEILKIVEVKKVRMKTAIEEESTAEKRRLGATNILRTHTAKLTAQGKSKEECKNDAEFQRHRQAITTFQERETALETEINALTAEITDYERKIEDHKTNAQQMKRDIEKIVAEKGEAIADVITAQEEERANKLLAGIGTDSTGESLSELRDLRATAKARAKASDMVSGNDVRRDDAAYDRAAAATAVDKDLDALLFGEEKPVVDPAPTERATNGAGKEPVAPDALPE